MDEILEAAPVGEEVALTEETVVPTVDLSTVSRQLERIEVWQMAQFGMLAVIFGCVLGVVFGKVVAKIWK